MSDESDGTRPTRRRFLGAAAVSGAVVAGLSAGAGTWAYFEDTESSTDNSVQAGTFDLKLSAGNEKDADGVSGEITLSNAKPGDTVSGDVTLENAGSIEADHVELAFNYDETESTGSNGNDEGDTSPNSADGMAEQFEVTYLLYDGSSVGDLEDANTNGRVDIDDLTASANEGALDDLAPPPSKSSGTESLVVGFEFADDPANDDYQGDELTVTITFALHQSGSQDR